jgi:hypothetical protein
MASARHVLGKLKSSDGRIKIKTLSGVSILVAVIALLVGVLPVFADHAISKVPPVEIAEGGSSGKCSVETGGLPSIAGNEFHIGNPTPGLHTNGIIEVNVYDTNQGRVFDFDVVEGNFVVYDVIVNGGSKSNHYDYDDRGPGPVTDADALHAPRKKGAIQNLSHTNICYDVPGLVSFACDVPVTLTEEVGLFRIAKATIFANFVVENCTDKKASFFIDNTDTEEEDPSVTLAFTGDTGQDVAGRLDVTKDFGDPMLFVDLQYQRTESDPFVDVEWCEVNQKAAGDGDEFDDVLAADEYPSLENVSDDGGDAISCKVAEEENAAGIQYTVVYFELTDPNWK